jgi:hypothetical protein
VRQAGSGQLDKALVRTLGRSARDYALEGSHAAVADMLLAAGGVAPVTAPKELVGKAVEVGALALDAPAEAGRGKGRGRVLSYASTFGTPKVGQKHTQETLLEFG